MLHITAILEASTLVATYDFDISKWKVTIADSRTGQSETKTIKSDELASIMFLTVQNEHGTFKLDTIKDMYETAEVAMAKFTGVTNQDHPLRIIP